MKLIAVKEDDKDASDRQDQFSAISEQSSELSVPRFSFDEESDSESEYSQNGSEGVSLHRRICENNELPFAAPPLRHPFSPGIVRPVFQKRCISLFLEIVLIANVIIYSKTEGN